MSRRASVRAASTRTGRSGFIGLAVVLVAMVLVAAIGITAAANYRKSKRLTFHVFSAHWWSVGGQEAAPAVDRIKETAGRWDAGLWGENGLLDSAESMLKRGQQRSAARKPESIPAPRLPPTVGVPAKPATPATTTPATSAPTAATPIDVPETRRLEQRLFEAEANFRTGYEAYKRADPTRGVLTDDRKRTINLAKSHFRVVRDTLIDVLPRYVKQSDHDPKLADDARELDKINMRLLENTNKMSGGL